MTKEEKEKRKLEKRKIKEEKKAQKLARKEEKRIAKLKKKGLYIEPEPPKEEPQEKTEVEEVVSEQVEETPQEEPQEEEKEEAAPPEPVEEIEEKQVQKKRKAPKQYHISLRVDNKWQLKFGGSSKALKLFDTQKEAIEYAKPLAAKQKAALVIHRTDGKIRKQDYTKK